VGGSLSIPDYDGFAFLNPSGPLEALEIGGSTHVYLTVDGTRNNVSSYLWSSGPMWIGGGFVGAPPTNSTQLTVTCTNATPATGWAYLLLYAATSGMQAPHHWNTLTFVGYTRWQYLPTSQFDYLQAQ
jgi:hypothetical protein